MNAWGREAVDKILAAVMMWGRAAAREERREKSSPTRAGKDQLKHTPSNNKTGREIKYQIIPIEYYRKITSNSN